jgi:DNA-binding winged helix-turn-helix (wHTH) protein/tetratricopeptide (TPR) repeat protein
MSKKRLPPAVDDSQPSSGALRWRFAGFVLEESRRELSRDGRVLKLEPKPFDALMLLLRHAGELVTKDEMIAAVWGGRPVTDNVIARCVAKLREVLGEPPGLRLVTVHGFGYRLDAAVEREHVHASALAEPLRIGAGHRLPMRPHWMLERRLEAGTEVWLARHEKTRQQRVFKLAFTPEELSALKREITLQRFLLDALPEARWRIEILDWNLTDAPWFLEMAYEPLGSLKHWSESQGGLKNIPLQTRLDLMIQAASAIGEAHAVGVLHKDVKPSNLLIRSSPQGRPEIAICDFGSGRVDFERLQALEITRLGLSRTSATLDDSGGTALYLAPELLAGHASTTGSDIYALGVMLYQLVTGDLRAPLCPGWERQIDDELLREDIAAAADVQPAHRLHSAAELAARLRNLDERRRQREQDSLQQQLALQAQRQLERSQLVRRWQSVVALALAAGLAIAFVLYRQARIAERQAQTDAEIASAVTRFVNEDLLGATDAERIGGGRSVTVGSLLDTARLRLQTSFDGAPAVHAELAHTIGSAYSSLGLESEARAVLTRALEQDEARLGAGHPTLRRIHSRLGWLGIETADYTQAQNHLETLLTLASAADDAKAAADRQSAAYGLARLRFEMGYFAEAADRYRGLLDELQHSAHRDERLIADIDWDLAEALFETHDWAEAERRLDSAQRYVEKQGFVVDSTYRLWLEVSRIYSLQIRERLDEAASRCLELGRVAGESLGERHPVSASSLHMLGMIRIKQSRPAEALPLLAKALHHRMARLGPNHYATRMTQMRIAEAELALGHTATALARLEALWKGSLATLGADHPHTLDLQRMLAEARAADGQLQRAEENLREVLALAPHRLQPHNNRVAWAHYGLGRVLLRESKLAEGFDELRQARALFVRNFGDGHSQVAVIDTMLTDPKTAESARKTS